MITRILPQGFFQALKDTGGVWLDLDGKIRNQDNECPILAVYNHLFPTQAENDKFYHLAGHKLKLHITFILQVVAASDYEGIDAAGRELRKKLLDTVGLGD